MSDDKKDAMPAWPAIPYNWTREALYEPEYNSIVSEFHMGMAEAWEARCRKAMEALAALKDLADRTVGESCTYTIDDIVDEALAAIGDLPSSERG